MCLPPGSDLGDPAVWVRMMTLQCLVGVSGKEGGREGAAAVWLPTEMDPGASTLFSLGRADTEAGLTWVHPTLPHADGWTWVNPFASASLHYLFLQRG